MSKSLVSLLTLNHELVGVVRNGEQMGRHFGSPLSAVLLDQGARVDGQSAVRVDSHAEQSGVGLK